MRLIKEVPPPCPCPSKLWEFFHAQTEPNTWPRLGAGTQIECDCGQVYTLAETKNGATQHWVKQVISSCSPNAGNQG